MKNYSNLDPIEEDGDNEIWIDRILFISLHNNDGYGEGYGDEDN